MLSEGNVYEKGRSAIVDFYLHHEKVIITLSLAVFLTCGFYYVDWHNQVLWKGGMRFHDISTPIDRAVPFVPQFIWIYLLYYPLCFTPVFLLHDMDTFRRVAGAYLMEFVIAFVVFVLYPVKMVRPRVIPDSLSTKAVALLYHIDPGFNVFPSMHVANSLLVALLFLKYSKPLGVLFILIAVLISVSTLYVKQHYLLDVASGVLDALIVYPMIFRGHKAWTA